MWLLKHLISFGFLGVLSCPRFSHSADLGGQGAGKCADELCGTEGAGTCVTAGEGYVCTCRAGFHAIDRPDGPVCTSTVDSPEGQRGEQEQETTEETSTTEDGGQQGKQEQETTVGTSTTDEGGDHGASSPGAVADRRYGSNTPISTEGMGPHQGRPSVTSDMVDRINDVRPATPDIIPSEQFRESEPADEGALPYKPQIVTEHDHFCEGDPCGSPDSAACLGTALGHLCICAPYHTPAFTRGQQLCLPTDQSACAGNPCGRGHTCLQVGENYSCVCAAGFHSGFSDDESAPECLPDGKNDRCADFACGPPAGVEGCDTNGSGQLECFCLPPARPTYKPDVGRLCTGAPMIPVVAGATGTPYLPPSIWDYAKYALTATPMPIPSGPVEEHPGSGGEQADTGAAGPGGEAGGEGAGGEEAGGEEAGGEEAAGEGAGGEGAGGRVPGVQWRTEDVSSHGSSGSEGAQQGAGGVGGTSGGSGESTPGGSAGTPESGGEHGREEPEGSMNSVVIAGGVIGALILVAAAGGGAAMYRQKQSQQDSNEGEVDFEQPVHEGVEVEADESEILINVSNADWAS